MNWVVMSILILAVIGSMLWVMPSPRDRMQAALRQKAMTSGMQVQMTMLKFPRAIGEAEADERHCFAYRLPRITVASEEGQAGNNKLPATSAWQVFKLHSHADRGLPEGWCWGKGEDSLGEQQLATVNEAIAMAPATALAIESTPLATSLYWQEQGKPEIVEDIKSMLSFLIKNKV